MNNKSAFLLSATLTLLLVACSKEVPSTVVNEQVVCVKTEVLPETTAALPVQCPGLLSTKHTVKLSFKTGGIISRIAVNAGSSVKKGQVLATLDMTEISSQVNQAQLAFEKADRDLERLKNLYKDTVATLEQLQDATSAYDAAMESMNIAEFNKRYSSIIAPGDGKIIAKLAEEHELVGTGMPVLIFSQQGNDEWVVKAGVSDKDIIRLKNGDKAVAELDAYPGITFHAVVTQISEAADPMSGTFEIELSVNPGNERLINGLVAKVKIEPQNSQLFTLVPPEAITGADGKKGYVYVVKATDTTAQKVPVTIAYLQNNSVAVIEQVNKLGKIVTKGASYLEDGSKLNISR
jgi:membrane fusion protein, multidrug efflux system